MSSTVELPKTAKVPTRRSRWRSVGKVLLILLVVLGIVRLFLPSIVRGYVMRALARDPVYHGEIDDVTLHLWRGAYTLEKVRVVKTTGNIPVPFFAAERVDLAIEWPALLSGSLVGRIVMEKAELNFVDASDDSQGQTGAGAPWLKMIKDLFPFKINSGEIRDGSIHFRAFHTEPAVDVYLSKVQATLTNLTNIHESVTPLVSTVKATALAMDEAQFEYEMKLDPLAYRPTFHLAVRLLGLDVVKTNALARAYGRFDFESGWLDLIVELDAKGGSVEGYVKPLFRNIRVLDLKKDVGNPLLLFWEALLDAGITVFKNQARDQVATVIPLQGDLGNTSTDLMATIGNLLQNAFVRAYLPKLEATASADSGITFGPGSVIELPPPSTQK